MRFRLSKNIWRFVAKVAFCLAIIALFVNPISLQFISSLGTNIYTAFGGTSIATVSVDTFAIGFSVIAAGLLGLGFLCKGIKNYFFPIQISNETNVPPLVSSNNEILPPTVISANVNTIDCHATRLAEISNQQQEHEALASQVDQHWREAIVAWNDAIAALKSELPYKAVHDVAVTKISLADSMLTATLHTFKEQQQQLEATLFDENREAVILALQESYERITKHSERIQQITDEAKNALAGIQGEFAAFERRHLLASSIIRAAARQPEAPTASTAPALTGTMQADESRLSREFLARQTELRIARERFDRAFPPRVGLFGTRRLSLAEPKEAGVKRERRLSFQN